MTDKNALIELVNTLANQEQNLEASAPGFTDIDLSAFVENPENIVVGNSDGVALFAMVHDNPPTYEGHYLFNKETTGHDALELAREMLRAAFTKRGVEVIVGSVPLENKAVRAFTHALGFTPVGESVDTLGRSCVTYRMERKQWEVSSEA